MIPEKVILLDIPADEREAHRGSERQTLFFIHGRYAKNDSDKAPWCIQMRLLQ